MIGVRRLASEQSGLTVVEVMVAALLLSVGALAVLQVADSASRNTFRGEQSQVVSNTLQSEIEEMKRAPYEQLALTSVPSPSSDPRNPNSRVSGTTFDPAADGSTPSPPAMVYDGSPLDAGGAVDLAAGQGIVPGPTPFESGDIKGNVHRYVVWNNDPACSNTQCPGVQDSKLLVVAATLDDTASGGERVYQEIQSLVPNPDSSVACPPGGCPPGSTTNVKPWTFWLTDTPCNNASRQPINGDHLAHNTRGVCTNGLKNSGNCSILGCQPGAPDLMFTQPAPIDGNFSSDQQPIYDYSSDVEPTVNPGADKGLQLINTNGCASLVGGLLGSVWNTLPLVPDLDQTQFKRIHKWVSPAIPSGHVIDFSTGLLSRGWGTSTSGPDRSTASPSRARSASICSSARSRSTSSGSRSTSTCR